MQFLKVNISVGVLAAEIFKPCIINLAHVKKISPSEDKANAGAKVTYIDGTTERLKETYAKISADILGELDQHYRAPEPLDATVSG
jgi:hypothetical protein